MSTSAMAATSAEPARVPGEAMARRGMLMGASEVHRVAAGDRSAAGTRGGGGGDRGGGAAAHVAGEVDVAAAHRAVGGGRRAHLIAGHRHADREGVARR